jgi:hypothetical protein
MRMAEVLRRLAAGKTCAVVIDRAGEVIEVIDVAGNPTPEFVSELNDKYPNAGMRFLQGKEYSKAEVEEVIRSMLEAFALDDAGALKPGANLR